MKVNLENAVKCILALGTLCTAAAALLKEYRSMKDEGHTIKSISDSYNTNADAVEGSSYHSEK